MSFSAKINDCSWYRVCSSSSIYQIPNTEHMACRYRVCDMNNLGAKDDANLGLWTVEVVPPAGESAPVKGEDP